MGYYCGDGSDGVLRHKRMKGGVEGGDIGV